ncbi:MULTISPECIES: AAA family ATPase [Alphaproteobacteria]|uniref:AAA family ATPase n=1 Tax=Alphaproteobacteria TaxID=28211 RepID=UPI0032677DD3
MSIEISKAQRQKAKLRVGIFGPSGSGKSMSALKMAYGLTGDWDKVCVIDTENNSAHLYSHLGSYSVIGLNAPYTPEAYIEAIRAAENAGFDAIIVDSITHEWAGEGGILELADTLAKDSKSSFTVWSKLTPRHNKFIEAILKVDAHVICCGRSKQDYAINQTEKHGKIVNVPEKIGLKAVTREGFDYEMTVAFDLMISHYAVSTKDRTSMFQDKPEFIISEATGHILKKWNDSGADVPVDVQAEKMKIMHNLKRLGFGAALLDKSTAAEKVQDIVEVLTSVDIADEKKLPTAVKKLEVLTDPEGAQASYGIVLEERAKAQSESKDEDPSEQPSEPAPEDTTSDSTASETV